VKKLSKKLFSEDDEDEEEVLARVGALPKKE
jgi:hypothetical protein